MARRISRNYLLLSLLLILTLPAAVPASDGDAEPSEKDTATPAPDRIYAASGVTISWDLENEKFHAPSAAQAARLAAAFAPPEPEEKIEIETLPDGSEKARVPLYLMSASAVRVNEGEIAGYCSQPGVESPAPAAGPEEE